MSIFSNRFFQGGITIVAIGIVFFAYQNFTGESVEGDVDATTAEIQKDMHQVYVPEDNKTENAINNDSNIDTINTAVENTTNQ